MAYSDKLITDRFAVYNGDCVEHTQTIPSNSLDMVVYSPPFAELYNYSSNPRDMSNCANYEAFIVHYKFLVNELYRATVPGRLNCIHCMDVRKNGVVKRDFPGDIIRMHEEAGFQFVGRILIWKEPLKVAIRTRVLNLRHGQLVKDSTICNPAGPDYIILMRKPGRDKPVTKPYGLQTYAGELDEKKRASLGLLPAPLHLREKYRNWDEPRTNKWAHWISPKGTKEKPEEKHVCPLQLDVIERCIQMWTNPDDIVYSPFGGIGSEPYKALQLGRKAMAIELKPSYYKQLVRNVSRASDVVDCNDNDLFSQDDEEQEIDDLESTDFDDDEIGDYET
jgi:DNA modification methylase